MFDYFLIKSIRAEKQSVQWITSREWLKSAIRALFTLSNFLNMQSDIIVRISPNIQCRNIRKGTPIRLESHFLFPNWKHQKADFFIFFSKRNFLMVPKKELWTLQAFCPGRKHLWKWTWYPLTEWKRFWRKIAQCRKKQWGISTNIEKLLSLKGRKKNQRGHSEDSESSLFSFTEKLEKQKIFETSFSNFQKYFGKGHFVEKSKVYSRKTFSSC